MRIALVSPEVVPFAKTGGLADVAGALPKALDKQGIETIVIMPKYGSIDEAKFGLKFTGRKVSADMDGKTVEARIYEAPIPGTEGVVTYFIDAPQYYHRDNLYGTSDGDYPDNAARFMFFSKAVMLTLKEIGFKPDVIHLNDWQSALVTAYVKEARREDKFFAKTATLYTVHNLGYQGQFWAYDMGLTGLGWEHFNPEGLEFYGDINLMKGGLKYADIINTVSETYAEEIQTPEYGHGMDGVLKTRSEDLYGIVNGIDFEDWDPATDTDIYRPYKPGDLRGKRANKRELKKEVGLAPGKAPLFGIITRLADQKGLDILSESIPEMLKLGIQMVILGTGEQKYHDLLSAIARKKPKKLYLKLGFDAKLARRIYAASDVFMMPSRYEPCGLGQLISYRYGAVPLVRKTGGLADTVKNYSPNTGRGTGFVFREPAAPAFMKAVKAALKTYTNQAVWTELVKRGMAMDNSWETSAKKYIKLYRKAKRKV